MLDAANMVRATIDAGGYDLNYMLGKIDRMWLESRLDSSERDQLMGYARARAVPADSYATPEQRLLQLEQAMMALEARVAALEASGGSGEPSGGDTPVEPTNEWPEYVQPTGAHDAYNTGDKITFSGRRYTCLMSGCVWSPADYPAAWQEVTSSTPEPEEPEEPENPEGGGE